MARKDRFVTLRLGIEATGRPLNRIRRVLAAHGIDVLDYTVGRDEGMATYKLSLRYEIKPDFEETTADLADELADCGLRRIRWL